MADGRYFLAAIIGNGEGDGMLALLDAPVKAVEEVAGVDYHTGDDGIAQDDAILSEGITPTVAGTEKLAQVAAGDGVNAGTWHRERVLLGMSVLDAANEEHTLGIEVVALGSS